MSLAICCKRYLSCDGQRRSASFGQHEPGAGTISRGARRPCGLWLSAHRAQGRYGGAGGGTRTPMGDARRIFLPTTAFAAAPKGAFGVWTIPSPCSAGAEGRCCPSSLYTFPLPGLARDCHVTGFPEFEQFYVAGFPARTQVWLSPLRLPFRHARKPSSSIVGGGFAAKDDVQLIPAKFRPWVCAAALAYER